MDRAKDLKLKAMQQVFSDKDFVGVRIDGIDYRFYGVRKDGLVGFEFPREYGKFSKNVVEVIFPTGSSRPVAGSWIHADIPYLSFGYDNSLMEFAQRVASDRVTKDDVHKFFKGKGIPLKGKPKNSVIGGVYIEKEDGTQGNVVWEAVPQNIRFELNELAALCR